MLFIFLWETFMDLLALEKQFWFILPPPTRLLPFHFYSQKQCPWLVQETDSTDKIEHQQEAESLPALWPSGARRTVWAPHLPGVQVLPEDIGRYPRGWRKAALRQLWVYAEEFSRPPVSCPWSPLSVSLSVVGQVRAHCRAVLLLLCSPLHPPSPPPPPHYSLRW